MCHNILYIISNSSNDIILTDFIIILTSVQRNKYGNYIHLLLVMILNQLPLVLYYINYVSEDSICSKLLSIVYTLTAFLILQEMEDVNYSTIW